MNDDGLTWRWTTNLGLWLVTTTGLVLLPPSGIREWLGLGGAEGWGLQVLPVVPGLVLSLLLLDALAFAMHRIQHAVPLLWRVHAVHHADPELDASTALRHHPLEVWVNVAIGVPVLFLFGLPVWASPFYAACALTAEIWQHANLRMPFRLERAGRYVLMTPASHRLHHARDPALHDRNFGMILSVWDRMFGSWATLPEHDDLALRFGLAEPPPARAASPLCALVEPFRRRPPG